MARPKSDMPRKNKLSIYVTDKELEALKQYCERVSLPVAIVARLALMEYIRNN